MVRQARGCDYARFVLLHGAAFGFCGSSPIWLDSRRAAPGCIVRAVLAMIASVEAISLTTFVLISQNRVAAAADKRADLDLQISLLTEHELTKSAELLTAIARHLGVPIPVHAELEEVKRDVAPGAVLDEIEKSARQA